MRFFIIALIVCAAFCEEMAITREYVDYLKKHVDWEVEEYENSIFRGWTESEFKDLLGYIGDENTEDPLEPIVADGPIPSSLSWEGDACIHEVRSQGSCGSCWAFAATGVLSDRCCMAGKDWGWLAPQELVSCDKGSFGCKGGYLNTPFTYFNQKGGLVQEADFPYKAANTACTVKGTHHCKCSGRSCSGDSGMKACLKEGPTTYAFQVCASFKLYKSGVYKCDCSSYLGGHAVEAVGYSDSPCAWKTKNSWGAGWGDHGYFQLACGTCRFQGGYTCKPNPA